MTETVATRYAGTRVHRVEDNRLLTGHGTFVDDVSRPGMLHACFVRSPFARARINGIDAVGGAGHCPACARYSSPDDLNPDVKEAWHAVVGKDMPDTPRPPLGRGRSEVRRRPGRPRRRREPVHRRRRGRAGGRRLRTAARHRRLHQGRERRCRRPRGSTPTTSLSAWLARRQTRKHSPPRRTSSPKPFTSTCTCPCRWRRAESSSSGWPPQKR